MEAYASIGFFVFSQLYAGKSALCKRWRHSGAIATTAMTYRYGTHLPAISRPAPAHVYRYVGQGDRTPLARNLGAATAT